MRTVLVLITLLFTAALALAQDNNQSTTAPTQQVVPANTHIRGCLTAGGDQFKLTTDIGARVLDLQVDKQAATPFIAHEVEVQGVATPDGNVQVERILDIADHCGHTGEMPVTDMSTITPKPPRQ